VGELDAIRVETNAHWCIGEHGPTFKAISLSMVRANFVELSLRLGIPAEFATFSLLAQSEKQSAMRELIGHRFLSTAAKVRNRWIFHDRLLALRPYGAV